MINTEAFDFESSYFILDKPYVFNFNLQAMFLLEKEYGTLSAAFDALFDSDINNAAGAAVKFVCALAGIDTNLAAEHVTAQSYISFAEEIIRAFERDAPKADTDITEGKTGGQFNWDEMYFSARYWLDMSDDEFWACTPRRFTKLREIWLKMRRLEHGISEPSPVNTDDLDF